MEAFRKLFLVAALAGLITGLLVTVAHHFGTAAIIAKAEVYEKAAGGTEAMAEAMPGMSHGDEANSWEPAEGFERTAYTAVADVLTGIGFALLLVSAYALRGGSVGWRKGMYWGLAGFAVFTLAPALGLPPEVPGTAAAPLLDRQLWWGATVAATSGGLILLFFARQTIWVVVGGALLVLPHLYGAPQPAEYKSAAPESLAHAFIVVAVMTNLVFWLALGALTGLFFGIFGKGDTRSVASPSFG